MKSATFSISWFAIVSAGLGLLSVPFEASARDASLTIERVNPAALKANGRMNAAAEAAWRRGALPRSPAEVAAKKRATHGANRTAVSSNQSMPAPLATVVSGLNFAGQASGQPSATGTPPDTTGAIGPTRFIQTVNSRYGIYNRSNGALINSGTLNELAGFPATTNTFDPQIIWDAQTNKFYYVNDSVVSDTENHLSFGFSKFASPNNGTTDFCHYTINYGEFFPDYPKLGDSQHFIIIGVNTFTSSFVGSDLVAIAKPSSAAISTCPDQATFKFGIKADIRNTNGSQIFTPVPSNQIDTFSTGYAVLRNNGLPAAKLWFVNITRDASTGLPVFGDARAATVPSYTFPPDAPAGVNATRFLDTLDARNTQAVQARNPGRSGNPFSFWTQHTIGNASGTSSVRLYEINPVPAIPTVLRTVTLNGGAGVFLFNAAVSPDRKVRIGQTSQFGQNAVVHYSITKGGSGGLNPQIRARSSLNGGAFGGLVLVKNSTAPYADFNCPSTTDTCRWGDYAASTPDPILPYGATRGRVWGTNQWSKGNSTAQSNWATQIFLLNP